MFLEHVGLRILLQTIHAPGALCLGAAGPGAAATGTLFRAKISQKPVHDHASASTF